MLLMQQHQGGVVRRLTVIGVPKPFIQPFVELMVKWEKCSGVEWTTKRLKSLKVDLFRDSVGLKPLTWIRKNRKGEVSGVIGSLFRWSRTSERNFSRCVQAFMAYTFYIFPSCTEGQLKKFLDAVSADPTDGLTVDFHCEFRKSIHRALRRRPVAYKARPLVTYSGSPEKRAPLPFWRSGPQSSNPLEDLGIFDWDKCIMLYTRFQRLYQPLLNGCRERREYLDLITDSKQTIRKDWENLEVGTIGLIQEPGGKLRSVASPFRIHQEALRPLGQSIYDVVSSLPWDCTFDQSKAIPHIQHALGKGGQVHSIDLSSATDYFPFSLQETALKAIFFEEDWDHIALFRTISRGTWHSPLLGGIQWTKGQPLGLYPSFGSFTLTHGLLLYHLADCNFHNQFFVVGDDVVITDQQLADKYKSLLTVMGCPWSADKSLTSNKLAEFAGKLITPSKVIPQLKWRRMSDNNFLDICRLLGSKSRQLLTKRQEKVFERVAHLCAPIGLNFSLPGDNLEKMILRTLDQVPSVERIFRSLMGLRRRLNQLVYSSSEPLDAHELKEISETFDEKVVSVMSQTIFHNLDACHQIGLEAFETLPSALGISQPRLPFKDTSSSRMSTLERYEVLLSL